MTKATDVPHNATHNDEELQAIIDHLDYLMPDIVKLDKVAAFTLSQTIASLQQKVRAKTKVRPKKRTKLARSTS